MLVIKGFLSRALMSSGSYAYLILPTRPLFAMRAHSTSTPSASVAAMMCHHISSSTSRAEVVTPGSTGYPYLAPLSYGEF